METKLDFPHVDESNWIEIEVGGVRSQQYPSPLEVKMLIEEAYKKGWGDYGQALEDEGMGQL